MRYEETQKEMVGPGVPYVCVPHHIILTEAVVIYSMTRMAGARTIAH